MKKLSIGKKEKVILIIVGVILSLGLINWLIQQVSRLDDEYDVVSQKVLSVEVNWPFRIEERKPEIVEKVTKEIIKVEDESYVFVRVSHYWPPLGGTNCANHNGSECISKMANGERWQKWVGLAIACPPEWEFGTKLKIGDRVWECKDRGSKIQTDGDLYWVDMLTYEALYDYGEIVKAEIIE